MQPLCRQGAGKMGLARVATSLVDVRLQPTPYASPGVLTLERSEILWTQQAKQTSVTYLIRTTSSIGDDKPSTHTAICVRMSYIVLKLQ